MVYRKLIILLFLLFCFTGMSMVQARSVRAENFIFAGRVTNESGAGIPGVTVKLSWDGGAHYIFLPLYGLIRDCGNASQHCEAVTGADGRWYHPSSIPWPWATHLDVSVASPTPAGYEYVAINAKAPYDYWSYTRQRSSENCALDPPNSWDCEDLDKKHDLPGDGSFDFLLKRVTEKEIYPSSLDGNAIINRYNTGSGSCNDANGSHGCSHANGAVWEGVIKREWDAYTYNNTSGAFWRGGVCGCCCDYTDAGGGWFNMRDTAQNYVGGDTNLMPRWIQQRIKIPAGVGVLSRVAFYEVYQDILYNGKDITYNASIQWRLELLNSDKSQILAGVNKDGSVNFSGLNWAVSPGTSYWVRLSRRDGGVFNIPVLSACGPYNCRWHYLWGENIEADGPDGTTPHTNYNPYPDGAVEAERGWGNELAPANLARVAMWGKTAPSATITCSDGSRECTIFQDQAIQFNVTANGNGDNLTSSEVHAALVSSEGKNGTGWPYNPAATCVDGGHGATNPWCGVYSALGLNVASTAFTTTAYTFPDIGDFYVAVNATTATGQCSGNPAVASYPTWSDCGGNTDVVLVHVQRRPDPECIFTALPSPVEAPLPVTITNSSTDTSSANWTSFGDTAVTPILNDVRVPTYSFPITYTRSGTKHISLTVKNVINVTDTCTQDVIVNPCKPAAPTIIYPAPGQTVGLNSSGVVTVTWSQPLAAPGFNNTCDDAKTNALDPTADDIFRFYYGPGGSGALIHRADTSSGASSSDLASSLLSSNTDYDVRVEACNAGTTYPDSCTSSAVVTFHFGPPAWYQIVNGLIHAAAKNISNPLVESIKSAIPLKSCAGCRFFLNGGAATRGEGILSLGPEVSVGSLNAILSSSGVVSAKSGQYGGKRYDYEYWIKKIGDKATVGVIPANPSQGIYATQTPGSWTLPALGTVTGKNLVILHDGDVIINNDVKVGTGCSVASCVPNGSLIIIAKTITVNEAVKELHAILIADTVTFKGGPYTVEADDPQLDMQGSVIGWDTVIFQRNLGYASSAPNTTVNSDQPAEKITYRPDMVESLRQATKVSGSAFEAMRDFSYTWKEVTP